MAKRGRKPGPQKRLPQTFKPGQSGNPGGRPAGLGEFRALCRENAEWAMEQLKKAIQKAAAKGQVLGVAAGVKLLWESAYGKPAQTVRVSGEDGGPVKAEVAHELKRPSAQQLAPIVDALARSGVLPRVIGVGATRPGADAPVEQVSPAGGGGGEPEGGEGDGLPEPDADGVPPA